MGKFITMARGIWMLRNKELVRKLGVELSALRLAEQVRAQNPGAVLDDEVILRGWPFGKLTLGNGTRVERGTVLALGDERNGWGDIVIGDRTWVGEYNNFRAAGEAAIRVGSECLVSQFCNLIATNHDTRGRGAMHDRAPDERKRGVTIGNGAWLGAGCTILPGVTVGTGAVIGAHSVVVKDVPAFEVWAGQPARKLRERG